MIWILKEVRRKRDGEVVARPCLAAPEDGGLLWLTEVPEDEPLVIVCEDGTEADAVPGAFRRRRLQT